MHSLLPYPHIAYDANCLIYYCMHSEIQDGIQVIRVVFPEFTEKIRKITELLTTKEKRIKTIEAIYNEIAKSERAGWVVNELADRPEVRSQLKLRSGQKFPKTIKFRIIKSLDKKIRGLKGKTWFQIVSFSASHEELAKVKNFYQSRSSDPRLIRIMTKKRRTVCHPSDEDMHLVVFSSNHAIPILTNDRELIDFKDELVSDGLCHKIAPLPEIVVNGET